MLVVSMVTLSFRSARSQCDGSGRASGCSMCGAWAAPSTRRRGQPSRSAALCGRRAIWSWRPHRAWSARRYGGGRRRGSASSRPISLLMVRLTCARWRGPRIGVERGEPLGVAAAIGVEVEREAVEPFRVACGRTNAEPDRHVSKSHRHAVRADAGPPYTRGPAEVATPGGERRGTASNECATSVGARLRLLQEAGQPGRTCRRRAGRPVRIPRARGRRARRGFVSAGERRPAPEVPCTRCRRAASSGGPSPASRTAVVSTPSTSSTRSVTSRRASTPAQRMRSRPDHRRLAACRRAPSVHSWCSTR